jgi:5-methylcytosine-specific restriction endonuclease McrA
MPIRPEYRAFYKPPEWLAIRQAVLERAGHRCEDCGQRAGVCYWHHMRSKWVVVQLGVAHLDNDPANNNDANLKALCRACHLQRDAPFHKQTRQARKDRARPLLAGM